MSLIIGGHRGSGCTDSPHAQALLRPLGQQKPPENTLESIALAIKNGAKLIEVDVVQTADNQLVVTHSNRLSEHVFRAENLGFVADYTYAQLKRFPVGAEGTAEGTHTMPLLSEVLDLCKNILLNIEIKDVKGTPTAKFSANHPPLVDLLAAAVSDHSGALIVSSFSTWDLEAMRDRLPHIPRGQLFDTLHSHPRPIYAEDCLDKSAYMPFTVDSILAALTRADIQYAHPCIDSMNAEVVAKCAEFNLGINTWALNEVLPEDNFQALADAVTLCREHSVQLGIITDYVPEMLALLPRLSVSTALESGLGGWAEGLDL